MHQRPIKKSLPGLERLEEKRLLSAGLSTRSIAHLESGARATAAPADTSNAPGAAGQGVETPDTPQKKPTTGFLMYLTGNQQWKPGQRIVFYVLTKRYYPLPSEQHSGFEFDLGGARSVAIPGPSAIALRIKYEPATFSRTLDSIITFGQGNQGGVGAKYGLPNTQINEFLFAATNRNDFGGYF